MRALLFVLTLMSCNAAAQINVDNFVFRSKQAIMDDKFTEAIELLNSVINVQPDLHDPYFLRAISKYNLGDYKGAEMDLTKALEIKPNFPEALLYRGVSRERMMNFNAALNDFDKALKFNPFNDQVIVSKAFTKTLQEEYESAIVLCNEAIEINKKNERAFLCRAWCKYKIYDLDGALSDYTRALQINKLNADTYTKRGMVKAFMLKYSEALEDLNKSYEMDSLNLHTLYQLAFVHRELENSDRAMELYSAMIEVDPETAVAYFERGQLIAEAGNIDQAIEDFTMVVVLTGGHLFAYFSRGSLYFEKGKYSAAVEDLSKAIDMYPGMAEAYYNRALAYSRMGMHNQAEQDMDRAREIKAELYILDASGQQQELNKIKELASIDEDFEGSDGKFGRIQNQRISIKPAPDFFVIPLRWVPDSIRQEAVYLKSLTEMTAADGKWVAMSHSGWRPELARKKQQELNQALANNPDDQLALLQQGILFQLLENYDLALEVYDALLQENKDHPLALLNRSYVLHKMLFFSEAYEQTISDLPNKAPVSAEVEENYAQIAKDLELIAIMRPEFVPARFNLANLNVAIGNYSAAVSQYEEVIASDSTLSAAHFNLGLTLLYLKNQESACKHLSTSGELGVKQAYSVMKRYCKP